MMMPRFSVSKSSRVIFWVAFVILTYLFLVPQQYLAPEIFDWWDKLQHSLAFGVLSILAFLAYGSGQSRVSRAAFSLVMYGALIEVLQSLSGWRYGEFRDWLADLLGIAIAWGMFTYAQRNPHLLRLIKNS
jgi:VanZ family protein